MGDSQRRRDCQLDPTDRLRMESAMAQVDLSGRIFHRVLKITWTNANPAGEEGIAAAHLI